MKKRVRVIDRRDSFSVYDMEGKSPEELVMMFSNISQSYAPEVIGKGYTVKFEVEPYGYDGAFECNFVVLRDENDKEYTARTEKERKSAEQSRKAKEAKLEAARKKLFKNEAAERAEYERLKEKFGAE